MSSLLSDNLQLLAHSQPDLAKTIVSVDTADVQVLPAKKGGLTLQYKNRFVHSKYDPAKEAARQAGSEQSWLHLHFGFGLGHFLAADQASRGGGILVYEPNPAFLRAALDQLDFKALTADRDVVFCTTATHFKNELNRRMNSDKAVKQVVSPYHQRSYADQFQWFEQTIDQAVFNNAIAKRTIIRAGEDLTEGALRAMKYSTQLPGVEQLAGAFSGRPGIIVSAGPSLDSVLGGLPAFQDKALIFAQSRTCRSLERVGIRPHFMVHNEFKPLIRFIEGCANLSETTFLLSEQTHPDFYNFPHGDTFVFQSELNFAGRWMVSHFPGLDKAKPATGGSVACDAFSLALLFGCDPIILVGQDLAMRGEVYYTTSKSNFRFDHEEGDVRFVKDYFQQGEVKTVSTYLSYLLWFQDQAESINSRGMGPRLINATSGGAHIQGFEQLKPEHVAHQTLKETIDPKPIIHRAAQPNPDKVLTREQLSAFRDATLAKIDTLRELCDQCRQIEQRIRAELPDFGVRNIHRVQSNLDMLDRYNQIYTHLQAELTVLSGFVQGDLSELAKTGSALSEMEIADDMAGLADQIRLELDAFSKSYEVTTRAVDKLAGLLKIMV